MLLDPRIFLGFQMFSAGYRLAGVSKLFSKFTFDQC